MVVYCTKKLILSTLIVLLSTPVLAARSWRTYEDCTLRSNQSNDGDSFHVRYKNRHYIFRLYFVDCTETDDRYPERVAEQADYFGISSDEAIELGEDAAKFTKEFLKDGFTVYSRLKNARGQSDRKRYFAMVQVGDTFLSEALVEAGLARIYGATEEELPDGTGGTQWRWRLKSYEKDAKRNKRGGWGSRLTEREKRKQQIRALSAVPQVDELQTGPVTISSAVVVYSLKHKGQKVGLLRAGAEVDVLGAEDSEWVRVRFKAGEGTMYEALIYRRDLGF